MAHQQTEERANSSEATSLKYLNYLEEMELKIRYMKNDIEFKRTQMKNQPKSAGSKSLTNSERIVKLPPQRTSITSSVDRSASATRNLVNGKLNQEKFGEQSVQRRQLAQSRIFSYDTRRSDNEQLYFYPDPVPIPSPTVVQKTLRYDSVKTLDEHKSAVSARSLFLERTGSASSSKDINQGSTMHSTNLTASNTRTVLPTRSNVEKKSSYSHKTTDIGQSSASSDFRTVLLPVKTSSTSVSIPDDSSYCHSSHISTSNGGTHGTFPCPSTSISSLTPRTATVNPHKPHTNVHAPNIVASRYKLVKTQAPFNRDAGPSCGLSNSLIQTSSQKPPLPVSSSHLTSVGSQQYASTTTRNPASFVQNISLRTQDETPNKRHFQGSKKLIRKTPQLKVQTAAKVVSKYKLKRLSPTLGLKSASQLFPVHKVNRALLKLDRRLGQQTAHSTSPAVSPHKLDRRPTEPCRNGHTLNRLEPEVSRNKLKLDRRQHQESKNQHKLDRRQHQVSKNRHKLDRRPNVSNSYENLSAQCSVSSVDNAVKIFKDSGVDMTGKLNGCNPNHNLHKLDNRMRQEEGKGPVARRQILSARRNSRHHWVKSPGSKSLITKVKKDSLKSRQHGNSKFVWRRTLKSDNLAPSSSHVTPSKFSWHRTPVKDVRLISQKRFQRTSLRNQVQTGKQDPGKFRFRVIDGQLYRATNSKLTRAGSISSSRLKVKGRTCTPLHPSMAKRKVLNIKNLRQQKSKLISVRGIHFQMDASGKRLCRTNTSTMTSASGLTSAAGTSRSVMDVGGVKFVQQSPGGSEKVIDDKTRLAASRAVYRSIAIAAAKYKKDNRKLKAKKKYCIFFGRFGKCHRGSKCPFIHDVDKVAVCTRFLRGKCNVLNCPFSHNASVHKMPVCLFYLRGSCVRPGCPYLHVNVNPGASVCRDFLNGFCASGKQCKKLHSHVCPSFSALGTCPRGESCPMLHRRSRNLEGAGNTQNYRLKSVETKRNASKFQGSTSGSTRLRRTGMTSQTLSLKDSVPAAAPAPASSLQASSSTPSSIAAQPSFISLVSPQSTHEGSDSKYENTQPLLVDAPLMQKQKITPSFLTEGTASSVETNAGNLGLPSFLTERKDK